MRFTSTIQPSGYNDSFKKVEAVLARVQAIRDAVGMDMEFGIDFHGRVHKSMAKVLAKELETYHPMFIEEPVLSEDIEALREVARYTSTPIATGERMFSRWDFKRVLTDGYVDIIQPDQSHAGGISECKKIAAMYMNAEVFLNGDSLFVHPYGYTPFWLEITELPNRGSDNLLRIVAQSRQPGTRWYSGGGLYREVSLVVGPEQCMLPGRFMRAAPPVTPRRRMCAWTSTSAARRKAQPRSSCSPRTVGWPQGQKRRSVQKTASYSASGARSSGLWTTRRCIRFALCCPAETSTSRKSACAQSTSTHAAALR